METNKIEPEISEHLDEGLALLDIGGACIQKDRRTINWPRQIFIVYAYTMTPLFEILDIIHQEKENLIPTLAFHLSAIWAIFVSAILILQWYRSKDNLIESMVRVREKQLLIGEVDGKLLKTVSKEINFKKNLIAVLIWCVVGIIGGGLMGWIIAFSLGASKMDYSQTMVKKYPFPLPLWFPVNYTKTKTTYILAGMFASIQFLFVGTCMAGTLALFYSFTTFGTIHFMILNNFLKTTHKRAVHKLNRGNKIVGSEEYCKIMQEELKKCIIYSQEILSYCDLIERTYSTILLIETFCSCVAITGSLSVIALTPIGDPKFFSYAMILTICLVQTFLFCYFGNRLTQEAENVRVGLYFNKWVDANKSFKKSMLIVMIRMSKPVNITMGKVSPVELTTFIQIVKAAYSFMALLQHNNAAVKG